MKTNYLSLVLLIVAMLASLPRIQAQQVAMVSLQGRPVLSALPEKQPRSCLLITDTVKKTGGLRKMMNSPGKGALTGFTIGAIGGVLLGLTGKEWVLHNGKVVPRPLHAIVDAFIVGIPIGTMGLV